MHPVIKQVLADLELEAYECYTFGNEYRPDYRAVLSRARERAKVEGRDIRGATFPKLMRAVEAASLLPEKDDELLGLLIKQIREQTEQYQAGKWPHAPDVENEYHCWDEWERAGRGYGLRFTFEDLEKQLDINGLLNPEPPREKKSAEELKDQLRAALLDDDVGEQQMLIPRIYAVDPSFQLRRFMADVYE
jgi:hypothetical protein